MLADFVQALTDQPTEVVVGASTLTVTCRALDVTRNRATLALTWPRWTPPPEFGPSTSVGVVTELDSITLLRHMAETPHMAELAPNVLAHLIDGGVCHMAADVFNYYPPQNTTEYVMELFEERHPGLAQPPSHVVRQAIHDRLNEECFGEDFTATGHAIGTVWAAMDEMSAEIADTIARDFCGVEREGETVAG